MEDVRSDEVVHVYAGADCKRNPGPAAVGVLIYDRTKRLLYEHSEILHSTTAIRAEYTALVRGLQLATAFTKGNVICHIGSEVVVNQINGVWGINKAELRSYWADFVKVKESFDVTLVMLATPINPYSRKVDELCQSAMRSLMKSAGRF